MRASLVAGLPLLVAVVGVIFACNDEAVRAPRELEAPRRAENDASAVDAPEDAGADAGEDAALGARCPSGSTFLRARTACADAPLTPPASLVSALENEAPGAVVSMDGMSESDAPCVPVVLCTPDDAPTMLFSDSPESPTSDGVLYADSVPKGRYRIYVYHANGGDTVRKFPVVVLNQGTADETVTIVRRGLAAPSQAYVSVGKTVLLDWFADRSPATVTVPAGKRVVLDATLDGLHAKKDELVHAIFDVVTSGTLKFSVVSVGANADSAAVTAGLPLLPNDDGHDRGTFPKADVLVVPADAPATTKPGVVRLRFGVDELEGTLQGIDAPTKKPAKLLGNYGMLYRFDLDLPSGTLSAFAPRGGGWGGVVRFMQSPGGNPFEVPTGPSPLESTTDAIVLGKAGPGGELQFVTAGGSNLPVDVFFVVP